MSLFFADLSPESLQALRPELTVFVFPVGGLEQHGPHLPLGVKLAQAEKSADELIRGLEARLQHWSFIRMPLIPFMVDGITQKIAFPVRPHVVRDAVVDSCEQLKRLGFKNFIVVNSHLTPKQITALEDASRIVSKRMGFGGGRAQLVSVTSALVEPRTVFESPMIALPPEHGGEADTSFMLMCAPEKVASGFRDLQTVAKPLPGVLRFFQYFNREIDGYWGVPSAGAPERAKQALEFETGLLVEKLIPWLERGQGKAAFFSSYRYFPFNGSFFKAYVLAALFLILMLVYAMWSMKDAIES